MSVRSSRRSSLDRAARSLSSLSDLARDGDKVNKQKKKKTKEVANKDKNRDKKKDGEGMTSDDARRSSRSRSSSSDNERKDAKNKKSAKKNKKKEASKEEQMQQKLMQGLQEWEKNLQSDEQREREETLRRAHEDQELREERERQEKQDEVDQLEKELSKAIETENARRLRKALQRVEEKGHVETFGSVYEEGEMLLQAIERIDKIDSVSAKINQSRVSEIHSFGKPADIVQHVMRATLMVMGHDPQALKDWSTCQREIVVMGRDALHKEIDKFDPINLDVGTAAQALSLLDDHESKKAYGVCEAAGVFYDWTAGVCEKRVLSDRKASNKRRKELHKKREAKKEQERKEQERRRKEEEKEAKKNPQKEPAKNANKNDSKEQQQNQYEKDNKKHVHKSETKKSKEQKDINKDQSKQ